MSREELEKLGKADLVELALYQETLIEDLRTQLPAGSEQVQNEEKSNTAEEHRSHSHSHSHSYGSHRRHRNPYEKLFDRLTLRQKKNLRIALFVLGGILVTLIIAFLVSGGRL